jgi:hypothetical protein
MFSVKQLPIRWLMALSIAAICTCLAFSAYFYNLAQQDRPYWGFEAPPPAPAEFIEEALAAPGYLAGLPLIIVGSWFGPEWIAQLGIILGRRFSGTALDGI